MLIAKINRHFILIDSLGCADKHALLPPLLLCWGRSADRQTDRPVVVRQHGSIWTLANVTAHGFEGKMLSAPRIV